MAEKALASVRRLSVVYFTIAVIGLIGTWFFNLRYRGSNYLGDWFVNAAGSSAAVDIIVVAVAAIVFYVRESRRLGWPWWVPALFVVMSFALAVCFALPLFLGLRELRRPGPGVPERA